MDENYYSKLINCKTKSDIFKLCYDFCSSIFEIDSAGVYFFDETRDFLVCRYRYGANEFSQIDDKISSGQLKSIIVRTALENTPQIIEDTENDLRSQSYIAKKFGVMSIISYPLQVFGVVQGVISFDFKKAVKFNTHKFQKLTLFINYANMIYENTMLLEKISNQDKNFKLELEKKTIELESINERLLLTGRLSALGQLASGVAHEIKNPLAIIKMLINTIDSELSSENKIKDDIIVVKSEIERLEEIVNHFLNFARPKKVERKPSNINDIILEVYDFLKIKLNDLNILVNMDLYLPSQTIMIDPNQIKQVFINILLNSIEACKNKLPAYINIKTMILSKEKGTFMKIDISDNGPGIKEDIISQIFTPFTTGRSDGLGLGLSICYRIISDHNGTITAKNRLSGGAKFEIILPVSAESIF